MSVHEHDFVCNYNLCIPFVIGTLFFLSRYLEFKTRPVEERPPPRYYIKKSSTGAWPRKVTKAGPLIHGEAAPYVLGLDSCFEAKPKTSPLHEGPPTIGRWFTHAD
jgi:hypothetical protein